MKIEMEDVRAAYGCARAWIWFKRKGLDWNDFLENGIDIEVIEAFNDALAEPVIKARRERF